MIQLCAVYRAPSNKNNFTSVAMALVKWAYVSMLFILELTSILTVQAN